MQDLRLIGVHEDGLHLLLAGADGERFRVPLDDALRAAARRDRPRLGQLQIELDGGLRPRDVQAMIRAGASAEEVAERSGWTVEKVHKYEGPILAERAHVAELARLVRVRPRGGSSSGSAPTLSGRVAQRMRDRGVDPEANTWDAWRSADGGSWTVVLTFAAGGRQRQASWTFDLVSRTVDAADDEARWLSEEEPAGKGPLLGGPGRSQRASTVYDVEAEGGVTAASPQARADDEPVDLMTAMRQRSTVRGRRSGARRKPSPTELPQTGMAPDDALPLEEIDYNPATDQPPPPAHRHPDDDPEVAAAEGTQRKNGAAQEPAKVAEQPTKAPDEGSFEPKVTAKGATARKSGRASVPSWDDIMFGGRRD